MLLLERVMDATKIAARIGRQERTRFLALLAVPEQRAPKPRHPLVPGKLHEGLRLGNADELRRLRPITEIVAAAVEEQIHGGAINELKALFRHAFPMVGRDTLAADAAG